MSKHQHVPAPTTDHARAALAEGVLRLLAHEPGARHDDAEAVHQMRSATRRLRAALRTFRPILDETWANGLRDELGWLSHALGDVRDLDVLRDRLGASARGREDTLGPLFEHLEGRHEAARLAMAKALKGNRYRDLRTRLVEAGNRPTPREDGQDEESLTLPGLAADSWKALRRAARRVSPDDPPEAYHDVRKKAKHARHAAEAVAPALSPRLGEKASHYAKAVSHLQDVLGEHQDAIVACVEIEQAIAGGPDDPAFREAAGALLERQRQAAAAARGRFPEVWDDLDRKKTRRWLKADTPRSA